MKTETKRPVGRPANRKIARLMQKHGWSRATAYRKARPARLRMQSSTSAKERGKRGLRMADYTTRRLYPKATMTRLDMEAIAQTHLANLARSAVVTEDATNWILTTVWR